jgi:uncharacterized membrane protein
MSILLIGLVLFIAVHSISIVDAPWRDRMAARLGEWTWKGAYSLIALAGFVLIVWGYGLTRAEPVVLYNSPLWLRYLAVIALVPVFPLLLATYLPGRIQTVTRHPMLAAVKLWAAAHLLANGTLADVVLFGGLLAWAVVDVISLKRRSPPYVPRLPASRLNDTIAVVGGLALYGAFIVGVHEWLIGVPIVVR